ncbi:MAG: hypothetical protein WCR02_01705 [Sphaerochaetaceae bacterium]
MEEDAQHFIQALETKRGTPILWRTYSTWYGNTNKVVREYGVFVYRCKDTFYFEDFERNPSIFGIPLQKKKNTTPFVQYEGSFSVNEIEKTMQVSKKYALRMAQEGQNDSGLKAANALQKVFSPLVEMVQLKGGTVHFFELIDRKAFLLELENKGEKTDGSI